MTTLTSRPLPLLPLVLPMTCNDRPSSAGSSPSSVSAMHPDSLLLQHHGVMSPRISSTGSSYSKNCETSPVPMDSDPERTPRNFRIIGPGDSYGSPGDGDDNTIDRMSCCSEDSELSVGQECCDNASSENSVAKSRFSSSVDNKQVTDDCESVDNASSLSDDNRLAGTNDPLGNDDISNDSNCFRESDPISLSTAMRIPVPIVRPSPTRLQEELLRKSHLYAEELMKQQMQFMAAARANAFSLRQHGTISPEIGKVGFRPHVKQTEITENLANFSGIHSHLNAISKISSQLACGESALSKLTAFGMNTSREPSQSPPSINQMNPHHLHHHHHHHHHPLLPHQFMNNNLNESNLKFSIDNILKADFGRRITDPILKRAAGGHNGSSSKSSSHSRKSIHRNHSEKHGAPIDLTNVVPAGNCNNNSSTSTSIITPSVSENLQHLPPGKSSPNLTSPTSVSGATTTTTSSQSSSTSTASATSTASSTTENSSTSSGPIVWPAWVYCTRYSDRPSSGRSPRTRKPKKAPSEKGTSSSSDEKRPRTAFSGPQLARLKHEFTENRYLTERRRQQLSGELGLNEAQIKIWFQNKRAKIKKASGTKNPLALQLMAQGLYNHSTVPLTREEEELQELQANGAA